MAAAVGMSVALAGAVVRPGGARPGRASLDNDWPSHGRDAGGQRFSPLKQITPGNVAALEKAWTVDTGATNIQVTPLVVDGRMFVTAGKNVLALEPETGRELWRFMAPAPVSRRGVAYWPGDARTPPRLFSGAGDRLLALDAKTGLPSAGFGEGGYVDLKASIRGDVDGQFSLVSPPAVFEEHRHHRRQQRRTVARPTGSTATSAAGTRTRASCSGRSTPCRAPASPAWRRGKARAGRTARARTCGRSSRSMSSAVSCTPPSDHRRRTTTAAIARGRTSTETRSSRWTRTPAA